MRLLASLRRARHSALIALLAAAPVVAEGREIRGELAYRERIALPAGTDLAVELRDASGAFLGEQREAAGERQVPLPFVLDAPEGAMMLRAALFSGGAAAWVSDPVAIPAGTKPLSLGTVLLRRHVPMGFATTFRCGEAEVGIGFAGSAARLRIAGTYTDLVLAEAASGARYEAAEDPGTWIWSKGNEMTVSFRGSRLPPCVPAVEGNLAAFRARGNEPGWLLVVDGDAVQFAPQTGEPVTGRLGAPEVVDGARRHAVEGTDLVVTVADRLARDTMMGMPYPAAVTVETGGATLTGAGGNPADLLRGVVWRAEDVAGKGIPDGAEVTVEFRDGRASGRAGCNRFTGSYALSGEGLSFGPIAATKMACPEALMTLEREVFDLLARTSRFDINETGALVLYAGDSPLALLRH